MSRCVCATADVSSGAGRSVIIPAKNGGVAGTRFRRVIRGRARVVGQKAKMLWVLSVRGASGFIWPGCSVGVGGLVVESGVSIGEDPSTVV